MNKKIKILLTIVIFALMLIMLTGKANAAELPLIKTEAEGIINGYINLSSISEKSKVTAKSDDEKIVSIDNEKQRILCKGLGTTYITITDENGDSNKCKITVTYNEIKIKNIEIGSKNKKDILYLNFFNTKKYQLVGKDYNYKEIPINNAEWKIDDPSIVTIDGNNTITAKKGGKTNVTVTAGGKSLTLEVTVNSEEKPTDLSKAKIECIETNSFGDTALKISNFEMDSKSNYYCYITKNNEKPNFYGENGRLNGKNTVKNEKDKYMYISSYYFNKYVELNQDIYLWIVEEKGLPEDFYDSEGKIHYNRRNEILSGYKVKRNPPIPIENTIRMISIDDIINSKNGKRSFDTYISFKYTGAVEKRKFNIKIGKITDYNLLNKIKNKNSVAIQELLKYAKNNNAVIQKDLTTTNDRNFSSEDNIFDLKDKIEDDAYYFIYIVFDDENGKYMPIEGVTIGQGYKSDFSQHTSLFGFTDEKFKWTDLNGNSNSEDSGSRNDVQTLPFAGGSMIAILIVTIIATGIVFYKKYNMYKGIK